MKKIIFSIVFFSGVASVYAQVNAGSVIDLNPSKNTFLDASEYTQMANTSEGKGLNFPRTNLTTFTFDTSDLGQYQYFKTGFDGMIVYNIATGKTGTNPATQGIQVDVEPGFYYFYNPTATEDTVDVSAGRWVRIGGGNAAPAVAGSLVATGTFTHNGGNSAVLSNVPTDIKAITGIKIVRTDDNGTLLQGGVAATTFYSYDRANQTMVFGQGVMSTSMPAGTYSYVIEYTK